MMFTKLLRVASILCAMVFVTPSVAAVLSVVATPNPVGVNTQGTSYITLDYTIVVTTPGVTVTSLSGLLVIDSVPVATPGGLISEFVPILGSTTVRMRERIRITRDLAAQIAQGTTTIFTREFNDGSGLFLINVSLIPSSSGAVSLRNVSLSFDDESRFRTVPQNGAITALMRLTTNGRGLLEGNWEVSGPTAQNTYRPVGRVRQTLSGARALVIESPTLPTDQPGIYRVRFAPKGPSNPTLAASFPEIEYSVLPAENQGTIELMSPDIDSNVSAATVFRWRGAANISSYRVEFLTLAAGSLTNQATRVAAVDVPPTQTTVSLKPFTLARLRAARATVYWRVLALDPNGATVATSPLRQIGR